MTDPHYTDKELLALAAYAHHAWAGWMGYLFENGTQNEDGSFTINADKVARWQRQMRTNYADLPAEEQWSDIEEARAILSILRQPNLEHTEHK